MFDEVMDALNIRPDGIYVDGTIGGAGHALGIAKRLNARGRLIGIDIDREAVDKAKDVLSSFGEKVSVVKGNYDDVVTILKNFGIEKADGVLLDLGVSSHELDDAGRGFSYKLDGPLDMRMDEESHLSAYDVVNTYTEERLYRVIRDYGEERFAKNIAKRIVEERKIKAIRTTLELADVIKKTIPAGALRRRGHPAKRTFQAIRIEVNAELFHLENALQKIIDILNPGGRFACISFHSLEDRLVKTAFRDSSEPSLMNEEKFMLDVAIARRRMAPGDIARMDVLSDDLKMRLNKGCKGHIITKKPIVPDIAELLANKRAKSAKLRVFERA